MPQLQVHVYNLYICGPQSLIWTDNLYLLKGKILLYYIEKSISSKGSSLALTTALKPYTCTSYLHMFKVHVLATCTYIIVGICRSDGLKIIDQTTCVGLRKLICFSLKYRL